MLICYKNNNKLICNPEKVSLKSESPSATEVDTAYRDVNNLGRRYLRLQKWSKRFRNISGKCEAHCCRWSYVCIYVCIGKPSKLKLKSRISEVSISYFEYFL